MKNCTIQKKSSVCKKNFETNEFLLSITDSETDSENKFPFSKD